MHIPTKGDLFLSTYDGDMYEFLSNHNFQETRDGQIFQYPAHLLRNTRTNDTTSIGSSQFDIFYQFVDQTLFKMNSDYTSADLLRDFSEYYKDALGAEYVKKINDRVYYQKLSDIAERIVENFENFRLYDHSKHVEGLQRTKFHDQTRKLLKDFSLNLLLILEISNAKKKYED